MIKRGMVKIVADQGTQTVSCLMHVYCKSLVLRGLVLNVFFLQWIYLAVIILDLALQIIILSRVI